MNWQSIIYWLLEIMKIVGVLSLCYLVPFLIHKGWREGENSAHSTKRVCDMCFRDISKWNDWVKSKQDAQQ